ncbi:MAG: chromosome segregation protein [Firmicutes bacterium ADurb.Bin419]|nr:MAG: chromosome segregation protein [Firmicutes bacterium ADurb.Bin419]
MICINKVLIENFQSHEYTELDFHTGLNVIIGPSDHGKSAVIRAIKWVLYNDPRGNDFIRQGTNFARVTLWLNNGDKIVRERTPSKNRYILSDSDGNTNVYEGFGNEVPHEIIKAHGIPKIMLDTDMNSSLNIGGQLEGPFLISESGSVRAKAIGRLTGLHIIDKSIRDSATDLRRENQTRDRLSQDLDSVEEKLKEYQYLDALEDRIKESSKQIEKIEGYLNKISTLTNIRNSLSDIDKKYSESAYEISMLQKIDECEVLLKSIEIDFMRLKTTDNLRTRYIDNTLLVGEMKKTLSETDKVDNALSLLKEINEKTYVSDRMIKARSVLEDIENDIKIAAKILDNTHNIIKSDDIVNQIEENIKKSAKLVNIKGKLDEYNREIDKVQGVLLQSVDASEFNVIINNIGEKNEMLVKLEAIKNKYAPILNNINEGNNYLNANKKEIEKHLKAYTEILKESGKCPLCNSNIGEDKLADIIKHYEEVH